MHTTTSHVRSTSRDRFPSLDSRSERTVLRSRHPNLLIVGSASRRAIALKELRPFLRHPVVKASVADATALSSRPTAATVVLENVADLSPGEQARLLTWLEGDGARKQLVTTSDRRVLPLVRNGQFLGALYYRLNIIYLDLTV